jgi:4-carboxymuconolactone decarboxylase
MALQKTAPRISPLDPPFEPDIAHTLERMMGGPGTEPLKLFRTVAHNPSILDKFRSTGSYLLNFGTLEPTDREVVILRTCARCGSEYEWGVHVVFYGETVGLSQEQIEATVLGASDEPVWGPKQRLLIAFVDELHDTSTISDDLWEEMHNLWTPAQLVELVALAGQYHLVSYFTNALQVDAEGFGAGFPTSSS